MICLNKSLGNLAAYRSLRWLQAALYSTKSRQKIIPETHDSSSLMKDSVGKKQELYMIDPVTPGSVFFLPHGTRMFNKLVSFMKTQQRKFGFEEVITPLIYKKQLWEKSGHWDNYKDDMFRVEGSDLEKQEYGLKPMNCPGHCLIFGRTNRTYKELPIRLSDFSSLHRNEASGALSGLTRVRRFHQDDGHIFCTEDQIGDEIKASLQLIDNVYQIFNIPSYKLKLSTRPENYIGDLKEWNSAESTLKEILNNSGKEWDVNEGDGAFYGPKIDVILKAQNGKEYQTATIQLDFQLPHRFDLQFDSSEQVRKTPIMIHRAVFGSLERFLAILIDHYQGKWPFWLSPRHALLIPVTDEQNELAKEIRRTINNEHDDEEPNINDYRFYIDIDSRPESVGFKMREARKKGYKYVIVVGKQEAESGKIPLSSFSKGSEILRLTPNETREYFIKLEKSYA